MQSLSLEGPFPSRDRSFLFSLLTTLFFAYTQIWHSWKCTPSEEKSCKIVNIILSKIKCTPQELSVLLTTPIFCIT